LCMGVVLAALFFFLFSTESIWHDARRFARSPAALLEREGKNWGAWHGIRPMRLAGLASSRMRAGRRRDWPARAKAKTSRNERRRADPEVGAHGGGEWPRSRRLRRAWPAPRPARKCGWCVVVRIAWAGLRRERGGPSRTNSGLRSSWPVVVAAAVVVAVVVGGGWRGKQLHSTEQQPHASYP